MPSKGGIAHTCLKGIIGEIFGSVNNLFNKAPPAAPELQFYTNPVYFDSIGRYYRVGFRVKI